MSDFASRLRDALDAKGMSMRAAAKAAQYDIAYVSRVLNGKQQPSKSLALALDRVLAADGELAASVVANGVPDVVGADDELRHMRATVRHLLDHDNRHGGDAVASAAVQVWRTGQRKLDSGSVPSRSQLGYLGMLAELAEIAGWLLFDAERVTESRSAFLESHILAVQAGDRPIQWFALDMLAMHGIEHQRPNETLRIADQLLGESRIPPRVALLARIRRARSLAVAGSRQGALRDFMAARSALDDSISRRDPSWTWWVDDRELTGHEGEAMLALGEPNAAVPKLWRALELSAGADPNRRVNLYYSVALLTAYAHGRAWRECESTLLSILPVLEIVTSGRSRRRLRATLCELVRTSEAPSRLCDVARDVATTL
ncbi:helix-turn-helix domain-containing protein [Streptomyces sp. NPDC052396]|uniref:helix-turn-helix domain-containing protein n=1 Tax=Streptomyces sp. NPDC052396 TaxID=3365689 RepID=UPI0037D5EC6A